MTVPKFRAWTEEGQVMYYYVYPFHDESLLLSYDEIAFDEVPASEFILMQSTGLFDKNGVEIFEGDIVEYSLPLGYSGKGEVIFDKEYGLFNIDGFYAGIYDYPTIAFSEGTDDFEVIGDINQQPHLLED